MPYEDNSINLYLNGNRINGLESLDVAVAPQSESLDYIGNMGRQNVRSSYPVSKLSLSKRYYGPDNFINLFSGRGINGYILVNGQTGNNLALLSGYLTNYSINFGLNQTPSIACDFEFYNNFGQLNITGAPFLIGGSGHYYLNAAAPEDYVFATQAVVHTGLKQVSLYEENPLFYFRTGDTVYFSGHYITGVASILNSQSSGFTGYVYRKETYPIVSSKGIKLDIDDARNNNLIQASVNFSFPRLPVYDLGSIYPSEVHSLYPTDTVCTLDFEPDNYSVFNQGSWPPTRKINTLNFRMYDRSGSYVDTLTLGSMELISEKASVNLDGTYRISAEYKKTTSYDEEYAIVYNYESGVALNNLMMVGIADEYYPPQGISLNNIMLAGILDEPQVSQGISLNNIMLAGILDEPQMEQGISLNNIQLVAIVDEV